MTPQVRQEIIMTHYLNPQLRRDVQGFSLTAAATSSTCADRFIAGLTLEKGRVKAAAFSGEGCAIATAAADLVGLTLQGLFVADAISFLKRYAAFVAPNYLGEPLTGEISALAKVHVHLNRLNCALLVSNTWLNILTAQANLL